MRPIVTSVLAALSVLAATAAPARAQATFSPTVLNDGLLYVSGITAGPGQASAPIERQLDVVLDELDARLKTAGSLMGRVVSTSVYLKNAADVPTLNAAWRRRWPSNAPTRTTVVASLPRGALVQVSAIATTFAMKAILPKGWAEPSAPWTYAIQAGRYVFMSGLVARRGHDNSRVPGGMAEQTHAILDNAKTVLAAVDMSLADVVSAKVFITDASKFQAMNEVYRTYFPSAPPARATVVAGLLHPEDLVEITLTVDRSPRPRTVFTTPAVDGRSASTARLNSRAVPRRCSSIR